MGLNTKKVLFLGVRNKYCCICAKAEARGVTASPHNCYKNWSGPSTAMESDIIAEGFAKSMEMHGLIYNKLIADGDSNIYKKILDCRPYDYVMVEKIECKNHLLRNMCNRLKEISKNSRNGDIKGRKLLGERILRIRSGITTAVKHWKNSQKSLKEKIHNLKKDIENAAFHVFGHHDGCAEYFCQKEKANEKDYLPVMKNSGVFSRIMDVLNSVSDHSKSLIQDVNNNAVEQYNSVIAKFVGGKRINYCRKGSYQARCNAALVSFNSRSPIYNLHKFLYSRSPCKRVKILEKKREIRASKKKEYKILKKQLFPKTKDKNYGSFCEKPDLSDEEIARKKTDFLDKLNLNETEKQNLFEETISQSLCSLWTEERRKRLTASNFGSVCNRLPYTSCQNLVKKILYSYFDTGAMKYGRKHEKSAIKELEKENIIVKPSGLFIDKKFPFLAASPDGLIEDNGIIEIKCPSSCADLTPEEGIHARKITFWTINRNTKTIDGVNKRHIYYYQIQGQMHITGREYCLFVLWTPKGMKIEKIMKDDQFWHKEMEEKLVKFYHHCLLPELVDPRYPRSMPIRDPTYIVEAQKKREAEKKSSANELK